MAFAVNPRHRITGDCAAGVRVVDYDSFLHFMGTAALGYAGTTVILTLEVTTGSLLFGGYTAWLTSHCEFRGGMSSLWCTGGFRATTALFGTS